MRRHICSTILSLLTCTTLVGTTGCDVETDDSIAADDDEFRLLILTYFGIFHAWVNLDSCEEYFDALGPELTADFQAIATCREARAGGGGGGIIITVEAEVDVTAGDGWALGDGDGVVIIPDLDDAEPCGESQLCVRMLDSAALVRGAGPHLVEGSPTGTGGLALAQMSAHGVRILPKMPGKDDPGYLLALTLEEQEPLVSEVIELGEFEEGDAVPVAVRIGPEGLTSLALDELSVTTILRKHEG